MLPATALRVIVAGALSAGLLVGAAHAEAPTPKDLAAVQACLKPKTNQDGCIGVVANACIGKDEAARAPSEIMDCFGREQLVWDQLLNAAYRTMRDNLDDDQRTKLRDMQRAWIDSRDKTCAFYYDYFQGTMANPMIANCLNRETGRRALFLMGFADDIAGWDKNNRR